MYTVPMRYVYMEKFEAYPAEEVKLVLSSVFVAYHKKEDYKYWVIHLPTANTLRKFKRLKEAKAFAELLEQYPCMTDDVKVAGKHYINVLKEQNLW
jgi:hypothetical protein